MSSGCNIISDLPLGLYNSSSYLRQIDSERKNSFQKSSCVKAIHKFIIQCILHTQILFLSLSNSIAISGAAVLLKKSILMVKASQDKDAVSIMREESTGLTQSFHCRCVHGIQLVIKSHVIQKDTVII